MKKLKLITGFLLMLLWGCESDINITVPAILLQNDSPEVFDTIPMKVSEYADIDGVQQEAVFYRWVIEDAQGGVVKNDFPESKSVDWVPDSAGYFTVKVTVGYEKNKNVTVQREVKVSESVLSMQYKMAGHWLGTGTLWYNLGDWGLDLFIDSTGHYYGTADYYSFDPYCEKGVFHTERLDFQNNGYLDSCGVPGNIPCQKLQVTQLADNVGSGTFWSGYQLVEDGVMAMEGCVDMYLIKKLTISADGNSMYFEFKDPYSPFDEWRAKFQFTRE